MGRHVPRQRRVRRQRRSGKTRKGSKWLSQTLVECAKSAHRGKDTYLAAQCARLRAPQRQQDDHRGLPLDPDRRLAPFQTGETYADPGGDFFARRDPERTRKRPVTQLERLGYTVTLQEGAAAA
jgi:transposase